ncbi:hypothetical protein EWM64_g5955 [Hericium alpestre]|uniref:C2H2-type domain-containing protein n=1 Tax=Hericium alpestre TaxID=135208 RepID=A0A4Y9ZVH8_9AGAM|nr:hypothetical protein EWM64_g5955 [Hericium alpestre]
MSTPSHPQMQFNYQHQHSAEPTAPLACMWNNCHETFASLSELVGHVNLQHLRFPASTPSTQTASLVSMSMTPSAMSGADLSCQWNNCNDYPTAHAIPGSSTSTSVDAALGVLANHLLHDHLGLQQSFTHMASSGRPSFASTEDHISDHRSLSPQDTPSSVSSLSEKQHSSEVSCLCQWYGCDKTFSSVDELTAHINAEHVGGGKAQYECLWEGCTRNGEKGFASKQKICRHIQSHTGHRPFPCKICKQHFSEAATLQQHMRRHTQEKPYICDFPGCSKAFAIAGALTIHKRTHNGDKPFKCTYCDRAFSESSNLSKHVCGPIVAPS